MLKSMFDFYKGLDAASYRSSLKMTGPGMPMDIEQNTDLKLMRPNLFRATTEKDTMGGGLDSAGNGKTSPSATGCSTSTRVDPPGTSPRFATRCEETPATGCR